MTSRQCVARASDTTVEDEEAVEKALDTFQRSKKAKTRTAERSPSASTKRARFQASRASRTLQLGGDFKEEIVSSTLASEEKDEIVEMILREATVGQMMAEVDRRMAEDSSPATALDPESIG